MRNLTAPTRVFALLMTLALLLPAAFWPLPTSTSAATQNIRPAGTLSELAIDDGTADCILGPPSVNQGQPGFGWVNKLTPATYPSTLRAVTIGFSRNNTGREVKPDSPYRIVVYTDPEMDGPSPGQAPAAQFIGRVRGSDAAIMTFTLATPLTIDSGSFVVGAIDEFGIAGQPALNDVPGKSNPPGSESFITYDGGATWNKFSDFAPNGTPPCNQAGSFLIRATVESNPVGLFTITRIQDPLAVEPWGVSANSGLAFITNYVSDNMTVVQVSNNAIQNIPLGDGPGGTPDGPFGVVGGAFLAQGNLLETRSYVTLFGSNTIPTKEFPVDYSAVGPGRVVVLKGQFGSHAPVVTINVGKGPRFPALATVAGKVKLYVPCGGANRVDVIDTTTNSKVAEIPVGLDPSSCTVAVNDSKIYVTNFGDGTISVIDPKTDHKIKDIPAPQVTIPPPFGSTTSPAAPRLTNPWQGAVSPVNGQLYVTYWGTEGNAFPNGAIAQFDTCSDSFVRATLDQQTRGTTPGSAGATGIAAPSAPLARDGATGTTPGAGGGGGGPFGIASGKSIFHPLVFTNDGLGLIGLLDTRTDQVTSSPSLGLSACPKPRGVDCTTDPAPSPPVLGSIQGRVAYVACGQPDNAILTFKVPAQTQAIAGLPVITSVSIGGKVNIGGSGFTRGTTLQIIEPESSECLGFNKTPKVKEDGALLQQKGRLTDGRKPSRVDNARIRLILPDGTVILLSPPFPGAT